MKKGIIPIFIILSILLCTPLVSAYDILIRWESNRAGYNQLVYHCNDSMCSDVDPEPLIEHYTETIEEFTLIQTQEGGTQYHAFYFYKSGYAPNSFILTTHRRTEDYQNFDIIDFQKIEDTRADIDALTISNSNPQAGDEVTVTATIASAFSMATADSGIPEFIPPELNEYYSSLIDVYISIVDSEDNIVDTHVEQLDIFVDETQDTTYTWTATEAGEYRAVVTTEVADEQADQDSMQPQLQEQPFTIFSGTTTINAVIDSPTQDQTINQGERIEFSGHAEDQYGNTIRAHTYYWEFEHQTNPDHSFGFIDQNLGFVTFNNPGEYQVTFNVHDSLGNSDSAQVMVTVLEQTQEQYPPEVTIYSPTQNQEISNTHTITWSATDRNQPDSTLQIKLEYRMQQSFLQRLFGFLFNNDWVTIADLPSNPSSYAWDTTQIQNGEYELRITATDNTQIEGDDTVLFEINNEEEQGIPVASFTLYKRQSFTVRLDASESYDPNGEILSYEWDFGDGKTGYGETKEHIYQRAGDYTITLTVTDNDGNTAQTTQQVSFESDERPTETKKHKFTISRIIQKPKEDTIDLYIYLKNKGTEKEKIRLTASILKTSEHSIRDLKLRKNQGAIEWVSLEKPKTSGKYIIQVQAHSKDHNEIRYVVVNI